MALNDNELEYQIVVEGRVLSKHINKFLAEASYELLDEESKSKAKIVPVLKNGKQVLLG